MTSELNNGNTDLEQKVTQRLSELPDVDASAIEPHAQGTKVTLEGSVDTVFSARKAVLSAETVDGVHDVESRLTLTGKDGASTGH